MKQDRIQKAEQVLERARKTLDQAEKLLEVAQAAKRLNRSQWAVRRAIKSGRLRAYRPPSDSGVGGHFLIPESAIVEFLTTVDVTKRA